MLVTQRGTNDKGVRPPAPTTQTESQSTRASVGEAGAWTGIVRRYFVKPLVGSTSPPWFDARGVAVGLAVGFGLPIGTQMLCLGVLRVIFRFNFLIAFAFTWVNNPITLLPMYYGYYCLGSVMLGKPVVMTPEAFRELMHPVMYAGHFWASIQAFAGLSLDVVARWAVSAATVGTASGILGYVLGYYAQRRRCLLRARRMGMSYEKLLNELERSLEQPRRNGSA